MAFTELITIAIPVYERYQYFEKAISSAVEQTMKCSIIIIDNASSHDKFKNKILDINLPHVKYIRNDHNIGMLPNLNKCIQLTKTPWISILHDDDMLHPQFVEYFKYIHDHYKNDFGAFAASYYVSDEYKDFFKTIQFTDEIKLLKDDFFKYQNLSPFPGIAFKREIGKRLGGFQEKFHPLSDLDLWYKINKDSNILLSDEKLSFYRMSPLQETYKQIENMISKTVEYKRMIFANSKRKSFISKICMEKSIDDLINFYSYIYKGDFRLKQHRIKNLILNSIFIKKLIWKYISFHSFKRISVNSIQ
ncbi:MAG: glycosyltransferase family 2 protein [Bacteroidales bacterium]|nr:glycosyltransferase family 2 protein [Bacteroidales bacterium]